MASLSLSLPATSTPCHNTWQSIKKTLLWDRRGKIAWIDILCSCYAILPRTYVQTRSAREGKTLNETSKTHPSPDKIFPGVEQAQICNHPVRLFLHIAEAGSYVSLNHSLLQTLSIYPILLFSLLSLASLLLLPFFTCFCGAG